MLRCNRANVNEGLLRGLCDNSSRVIAIIRDRLEAPRQGIEPCYAGLESAFLPEAKACEQFQHVLRCDHLAGPKPITLMEPLFIRLERQHLSDTVSRIWFVYERVSQSNIVSSSACRDGRDVFLCIPTWRATS